MANDLGSILELAGEPVAYMNPYGGVLTALSTGLEKATFNVRLYTAEQALAMRKPLEESLAHAAALQVQSDKVIADLTDGYAKLEDELKFVKDDLTMALRASAMLRQQLSEKDTEIGAMRAEWHKAYDIAMSSKHNLAAAQADNERLRDALRYYANTTYDVFPSVARRAIAQPSDTSALEAMIAKAGEVMRERCASGCESLPAEWTHEEDEHEKCANAIRALPGVTLEDLQG